MLPKLLAQRLSERLATVLGLHFPPERHIDLEQRISWAMREAGHDTVEAFALELLNGPFSERHIAQLAPHLTVSETYFFRDARLFEALEREVLPALIARRSEAGRTLRIWSAGCSTGEEAYSLAILLGRLLPMKDEWDVTILGTDVNERSLAQARAGLYRAWSFRGISPRALEPYVQALPNSRFQATEETRNRVRFVPFNLVDDSGHGLLPGGGDFDLILCRNVLMYLTPEAARRAVANLRASLAPDGLLVTSPVDASRELFRAFSPLSIRETTFYQPIEHGMNEARGDAAHASRLPSRQAGTMREPGGAGPDVEEIARDARESLPTAKKTSSPPAPGGRRSSGRRHERSAAANSRAEQRPGPPSRELIRLGRQAADEGRLEEAAELCRQAIAADKATASYRYLLAVIELERDNPAEALRALTQAVFLDPHAALPHVAMGNLRQAQSRHREADRHFATAAKLLRELPAHEAVRDGEGLTVGRLLEMVEAARASLKVGSWRE